MTTVLAVIIGALFIVLLLALGRVAYWRRVAISAEGLLWNYAPQQMAKVHGSREAWAARYGVKP